MLLSCTFLSFFAEHSFIMENRQNIVPRRLFQDEQEADKDNLINFIEEIRKSSEESKKKWNFDFSTETPLEGDWEWEKVDIPQNNTPTATNENKENQPTQPPKNL